MFVVMRAQDEDGITVARRIETFTTVDLARYFIRRQQSSGEEEGWAIFEERDPSPKDAWHDNGQPDMSSEPWR